MYVLPWRLVSVQQWGGEHSSAMFEKMERDKKSINDYGIENPEHGLFSCQNAGCGNVYQSHSSLEKHLSFEQGKLIPDMETLLDKAKKFYQERLLRGTSYQAIVQCNMSREGGYDFLQEEWALKSSKKAAWFDETQKQYLDEKFNLGKPSGHKCDPGVLAKDIRYARNKDSTRQFKVSMYFTSQQVQSFFPRISSKLRHRAPEDDLDAKNDDLALAEDHKAYDCTAALVIRVIQLSHPIVVDTYNLCDMHQAVLVRYITKPDEPQQFVC